MERHRREPPGPRPGGRRVLSRVRRARGAIRARRARIGMAAATAPPVTSAAPHHRPAARARYRRRLGAVRIDGARRGRNPAALRWPDSRLPGGHDPRAGAEDVSDERGGDLGLDERLQLDHVLMQRGSVGVRQLAPRRDLEHAAGHSEPNVPRPELRHQRRGRHETSSQSSTSSSPGSRLPPEQREQIQPPSMCFHSRAWHRGHGIRVARLTGRLLRPRHRSSEPLGSGHSGATGAHFPSTPISPGTRPRLVEGGEDGGCGGEKRVADAAPVAPPAPAGRVW